MRSHRRKARRYCKFPVMVNTHDTMRKGILRIWLAATASAEFGGTGNRSVHLGELVLYSSGGGGICD